MADLKETERQYSPGLMGRLEHGVRMLLGTFIIVSVGVNFTSVVARYVFLEPLFWAETVITYLMIWSVFIGAALVSWEGKHLNMDILSGAFSGRWQAFLRLLGAICLFVALGVILPQSWEISSAMVEYDQRTSIGDIPMIIPHAALLIGFGLMGLAAVFHVVKSARAVLGLTSADADRAQKDDPETHPSVHNSLSES